MRIRTSFALVAAALFLGSAAAAPAQLTPADFYKVIGLGSSTSLQDAQLALGFGFEAADKSSISFYTKGPDGTNYHMTFAPGASLQADCGWLLLKAPQDPVTALCRAPDRDSIRALLAAGKDRETYLTFLGARPKGVQFDFGTALVSLTIPDPQGPATSLTVSWCTLKSECE